MDISFSDSRLQKLCSSGPGLQRKHGIGCAKKVGAHLASLQAAPALDEFRHLPGGCHELTAERAGQFALKLPDGKRLIFEPSASPPPTLATGGVDWKSIRAIRIIEIADYH